MFPAILLPNALADLFATASETGELTLADRYGLQAALLSDAINDEERRAIDRLLRAAVRGRVKLSSALSRLA